jgi:HEAT repeat protein
VSFWCPELGNISPSSATIVSTLLLKTGHSRADVRQAAAEALENAAERGDTQVVERLHLLATSDEDLLVRDSALSSLATISLQGSPQGEYVVTRLLGHGDTGLRSQEWDERWRAAESLMSHFDSSLGASSFSTSPSASWHDVRNACRQGLMQALNDASPEVRMAAAKGVAREALAVQVYWVMAQAREVAQKQVDEQRIFTTKALTTRLLMEENKSVLSVLLSTLTELGADSFNPKAVSACKDIARTSREQTSHGLRAAKDLLGLVAPTSDTEAWQAVAQLEAELHRRDCLPSPLLLTLSQYVVIDKKAEGGTRKAEKGSPQPVSPQIENESDVMMQRAALVEVLEALQEQQCVCVSSEEVQCLLVPLHHSDALIRERTLQALPSLVLKGDERVLAAVVDHLSHDESYQVRACAAAALGELCRYGDSFSVLAVSALISTLKINLDNEDASLCVYAASALESIATPSDARAWQSIAEWQQRQEAEGVRKLPPPTLEEEYAARYYVYSCHHTTIYVCGTFCPNVN